MKILFLDGNYGFRRALSTYLTRHGYLVDGRNTVNEALDALRESKETGEHYAAAIVEMNGYERFLVNYKDIAPGLPVLVVTGEPDWRAAARALSGGRNTLAVSYLSKSDPDLHEYLLEALERQITAVRGNCFTVDLLTYEVFHNGELVHLPRLQVELLAHFIRNRKRRIDYIEIAQVAGHGTKELGEARAIMKSTMSQMRANLAEIHGDEVISSIPRVGFRFIVTGDCRTKENNHNHEKVFVTVD